MAVREEQWQPVIGKFLIRRLKYPIGRLELRQRGDIATVRIEPGSAAERRWR